MKKSFIKVLTVIASAFTVLLSLAGCDEYEGYPGEYPAAFTEAVYSTLMLNGYWSIDFHYVDAYIVYREEDAYGRILYTYTEDYGSNEYLFVMQKADDYNVWYYPDYNFRYATEKQSENLVFERFTENEVADLKEKNDWGKEFNEKLCVKSSITRKKETVQITEELQTRFQEICKKVAKDSGCKGEDDVLRSAEFLWKDEYGRELYYLHGIHRDVEGGGISPTSEKMFLDILVILNYDGTINEETGVAKLTDAYNCQDELRAFKNLNGWGTPYAE